MYTPRGTEIPAAQRRWKRRESAERKKKKTKPHRPEATHRPTLSTVCAFPLALPLPRPSPYRLLSLLRAVSGSLRSSSQSKGNPTLAEITETRIARHQTHTHTAAVVVEHFDCGRATEREESSIPATGRFGLFLFISHRKTILMINGEE